MATLFYPKGKENLGQARINLLTDTMKITLIDTALYTYNAAHDAYDDVAAGARLLVGTLTGVSFTDGVLDANDITLTGPSTATGEAFIIWKDSGTPSTSWLFLYLDNMAALPVPSGVSVAITWDNGSDKIARL